MVINPLFGDPNSARKIQQSSVLFCFVKIWTKTVLCLWTCHCDGILCKHCCCTEEEDSDFSDDDYFDDSDYESTFTLV